MKKERFFIILIKKRSNIIGFLSFYTFAPHYWAKMMLNDKKQLDFQRIFIISTEFEALAGSV